MATARSIINKAYLLTGGNIGDPKKNLAHARTQIAAHCGHILHSSSLYETAAWGKKDQPAFINQALEIETTLLPQELLQKLLDIEKMNGRIRQEKYGPRTLDIDILLYDDRVIREPLLTIPHPELQNRRFALAPLAEIAPLLVHPVFDKTIRQLLEECADMSAVRKL
jgi:2-amino-4-hydroxy-6-hydroxymethyldihydropteridine diphosphokinase